MTDRHKFVMAARSCAGLPYRWGGQGPDAFDCSGLVVWCFRQIGKSFPDMCASDISEYFHCRKILPSIAKEGCICFYGAAGHISHVMIVNAIWGDLSSGKRMYTLIGARGGLSITKNNIAAFATNAMVDVVRGDYWLEKWIMMLDPFNDKGEYNE
jgi:hypothetical protein